MLKTIIINALQAAIEPQYILHGTCVYNGHETLYGNYPLLRVQVTSNSIILEDSPIQPKRISFSIADPNCISEAADKIDELIVYSTMG